MSEFTVESCSESATEFLGQRLGSLLGVGDCVVLSGELGTGKTAFSRGAGKGLGICEQISSPTYLLCHEYSAEHCLLHIDAYFKERIESLLADGLIERFAESTVIIEWGTNILEWLPDGRIELALECIPGHPETRTICLTACGKAASNTLKVLKQQLQSGPLENLKIIQ